MRRPDVLLVQTPPAVPTLLVAWLAARLRRARLVIDWHNFGYAMLALRVGPRHVLVRLAERWERALGRRADAHLCVSRAMAAELEARWAVAPTVVLYDRPPARFAPTPPAMRRALVDRVVANLRRADAARPVAIVVSPSSWSPDDDFALLLDAARRCDAAIAADAGAYPDLVIVATGDGPLRARWVRAMERLSPRHVHLQTLWLAAEEYPAFLGCADLGLSVHRSASGVDLPMKLADCFGAGIPVCAFDYGPCLGEIVRHGENGLLFATAEQLAEQLTTLFHGYPERASLLARLRAGVAASAGERWDDAWRAVARPVVLGGLD
jgi:beta-1,4-mannosyltransferase